MLILPCFAADYAVLTNTSGASILAQPLSIKGEIVLLLRDDGRRFEAPLSLFTAESQTVIHNYVSELEAALKARELASATPPASSTPKKPATLPSTTAAIPAQTSPGEQLTTQLEAPVTFADPQGDYHLRDRVFPEMDMLSVTLDKKQPDVIAIRIDFAAEIPEAPEFTRPYRIWLALDMDDAPSTGMPNQHGEEYSVAISGWRKASSWDHYVVPKPGADKQSPPVIRNIEYADGSLSFEVKCRTFRQSDAIRLQLSANVNAGRPVDTFPGGSANSLRCILKSNR
ncbi:MAG: hypothetical protein ABII82_04150 [Verrucomicrobiota bacterium]